MLTKVRPRLTFANVMSVVAVFIALGGTSVATHEAIFSDDIVDGQVQRPDLGFEAVSSGKILDGTVATRDLQSGALTTSVIANGAVTNPKLKDNAVTGIKVLDNSLTGADIDESQLGKVPDADKVDGLDSTAFLPSSRVVPIELSGPQQSPGELREVQVADLLIRAECLSDSRKRVELSKASPFGSAATLNWFFGSGASVEASGQFVGGPGFGKQLNFDGGRIEGQFIFSSVEGKVTVNLHAFNADPTSGCEVHGTALVAR